MINLRTLASATEQQVFDQVAKHLLIQNAKCQATTTYDYCGKITTAKACAYRSDEGSRACAAGCLISDEEMKAVFDAKLNTGAGWVRLIDEKIAPAAHENLIRTLQDVHDGHPVDGWREGLMVLAQRRGLNIEVLNAFSS
jgi:hypothetical protein